MSATDFDVAAFTYAHRGLWGGDIPENSLRAFAAAAREGLGCELDVRVTADHQLVVFHDATLQRMCVRPERVDALPLRTLRAVRLPDGSTIPTLEEALEAMNGLPVLVELKTDATRGEFDGNHDGIPALTATLNNTSAPAAVMSFDEDAVNHLADLDLGRPLGQLIEPSGPFDEGWAVMKAIRADQGPAAFLAPHISDLPDIAQQFPHLPRVTWTIRDLSQLDVARAHGAAPIFEGFSPTLAKSRANTI
ncbi:MAG: glycerophosphodiester phosphodiesterase family protein [Hyphomonadaceae bacterium]